MAGRESPRDRARQRAAWRDKAESGAQRRRGWWEQHTDRDLVRRRRWRRLLIFLSTGAVAGLVGLFIWKVLFAPSPTPFYVISISDYPAPIPPNAWAKEDVELFRNKLPDSLSFVDGAAAGMGERATARQEEETLAKLAAQLKSDVRPGGPDSGRLFRRGNRVVVLYFSAHGMLNREGEPCLILAPTGKDWGASLPCIRLSALLKTIQKSVDDPSVKKLVVLDCNRIDADWRLGILANGFADRIEKVVGDLNSEKDLVVLNSTSPGQIGWASPEKLENSVFAYFLWRGLSGEASEDKEYVTLQGLERYLAKQVGSWVAQKYSDIQTPLLIPADAADFRIAYARQPRSDIPTGDTWKETDQLWRTDVAKLWEEHAKLSYAAGRVGAREISDGMEPTAGAAAAINHLNQLSFAAFEQQLLRLEQILPAGSAYQDERNSLIAALRGSVKQLADADSARSFSGFSLPPAAGSSGVPAGGVEEKAIEAAFAAGAKEGDKTGQEAAAKAGQALKMFSYPDRARAVWNCLRKRVDTLRFPSDFDLALQIVGEPGDGEGPELIEMHFLRLLSNRNVRPAVDAAQGATSILPALDCRDWAERAAASAGDERTQYFIRGLMDQADNGRRQAEDQLFIDGHDDSPFTRTANQYKAVSATVLAVAEAFQTRDRAYAELPYLARWLDQRSAASDSQGVRDLQPLCAACLNAIKANRGLAAGLDEQLEANRQASLQHLAPPKSDLRPLVEEVRGPLDQVRESYENAYKDYENHPNVASALRVTSDLLRVPLLTGEKRNGVRKAWLASVKASREKDVNPADSAQAKQAAADARPRLAPWGELHPALALVNLTPEAPPAAAEGDEYSRTCRRLAADGDKLAAHLHDVRAKLMPREAKPLEGARPPASRPERSQADQLARSAASLLNLPGGQGMAEQELGDPIGALQRFDLHAMYIWHGLRAVEDFWGDDFESGDHAADAKSVAKSNYFETLAAAYLQKAVALEKLSNDKFGDEAENRLAPAGLDPLKQAANNFTTLKIDVEPLSGPSPTFTGEAAIAPDARLPKGTVAVLALDPQNAEMQWGDTSLPAASRFSARHGWPIPGAESAEATKEYEFQIPGDIAKSVDAGNSWKLAAWYRGHFAERLFSVTLGAQDREVVYWRQTQDKPTIEVLDQTRSEKPGAIAFILDCSWSMDEPHGKRPSRMDKVRNALDKMLDDLSAVGGYKVSLWLYGHRRGVRTLKTTPETYAWDWNAAWGPEDPKVLYRADVARVWPTANAQNDPPGTFDKEAKKQLSHDILFTEKVKPLGCTPLYLAMKRAAEEDLAKQDPNLPRRLIVLTDGFDEVSDAKEVNGAPVDFPKGEFGGHSSDLGSLRTLFNNGFGSNSLQLSLLLCDVGEASPTEKLERPNFVQFIDDVRGKAYDIKTSDENSLAAALGSAIGPTQFLVRRGGDSAEVFGPSRLNQQLTVDKQSPGVRLEYSVEVPQPGKSPIASKVALEGGEALVLRVNAAGTTLNHARYDPDAVARDDHSDETYKRDGNLNPKLKTSPDEDFNPQTFFIAAHRPKWENGLLEIPVSIQNGDALRFSPRPAEFWAEITPVSTRGGQLKRFDTYLCYDPEFEAARPVPVLLCHAKKWPEEADQAEVRVWFKFDSTKPSLEQRVGNVAGTGNRPNPDLDLTTASGHKVHFAVQTAAGTAPDSNGQIVPAGQIVVVEQHEPGETEPFPVKVEVAPRTSDFAPADEVQREFIKGGEKIKHTFTFLNRARVDDLNNGYWLRLTKREDLQKDAVEVRDQTRNPLRVKIPPPR